MCPRSRPRAQEGAACMPEMSQLCHSLVAYCIAKHPAGIWHLLHAPPLCLQIASVMLWQGKYHMFVAATPYIEPLMFHLATQQNAMTMAISGAEKTKFAW